MLPNLAVAQTKYCNNSMTEVCIDNIDSESNLAPGLILIPDISGFTEYIINTDLQHSQKKIGELLETILYSNVLHMSVSELEGDAVLFYSLHDQSSLSDVIGQCEAMYVRFHEKLNEFASDDKWCQCGNCQLLLNLGLKFFVHYGTIGSLMVNGFCKLYGQDIILAHRLMKNSIDAEEYMLFTQEFYNLYKKRKEHLKLNTNSLLEGKDMISGFGEVFYYYLTLTGILLSEKKNIDLKKI
jgi:uncharacterized protein DUF2652